MIIFAGGGGTGIEERAASTKRIPCDVERGPLNSALSEAVSSCGLSPKQTNDLAEAIRQLFAAARSVEARSLEINPLVLTNKANSLWPIAESRSTITPLGVILISGSRSPRVRSSADALERIAYAVEQNDHRGTFYFAQLATSAAKDSKGLVGFHGAGAAVP